MTRRWVFAFVAGVILLGVAAPPRPAAGEPRAATQGQLQDLINEINIQLQRGERERLIDPWFLRDLRQTIERYEYPWSRRLFRDDFSGRGPQPDPPWQVRAGEFLIDWRLGLRSVVERPQKAPEERPVTQEEMARQLFGEILKKAIEDKEGQRGPPEPDYAAAIASLVITNAFMLRLEMTSRSLDGGGDDRFEFGPYQGDEASVGYRLIYMPGQAPSLVLNSISPRGTISTIEIYSETLDLEDDQAHVIQWSRNAGGHMAISVDGNEVISVTDRRFRDRFDGFIVVNAGGDYALRCITIDGTD